MKRMAKTLIVDDSVPVLIMMESLLNLHGIADITKASAGFRGLEFFEKALRNGEPYSLVFLDIIMPGMDGVETLKRMRALETRIGVDQQSRATIIMISGLNSPADTMVALAENGSSDYLAKPFRMEDMLAKLTSYDFL